MKTNELISMLEFAGRPGRYAGSCPERPDCNLGWRRGIPAGGGFCPRRSHRPQRDARPSLPGRKTGLQFVGRDFGLALPGQAHPSRRRIPVRFALTVLLFLAAMIIAAISLATAPRSHWETMVFGSYWLECLIAIPTVAVVPFAAIMSAVRRAAPTDLVRTGALAGLVAGGVSATAYALHCMDDLLPFIALWYGGTIVLCTVTGAVLGPKLLRW